MYKRIISGLLCIILVLSSVPMIAEAEELTYYQIRIDAGNGVQSEKAIIENDEIYISAKNYSKYTRFEFDEEEQTFVVKGQEIDKAFKKVKINAETKKAAVGEKIIELENSFMIDGEAYLPFCQMLPILNADIIDVDSEIIYVVNNKISMTELLYDFDINDYYFNISREFFENATWAYLYCAPSYIFDTVTHFRFDRLDIIFESGECADYQTILEEYLKDNELYYEAMSERDYTGELLNSITGLNNATGQLDDVYDWFDGIEEIDYEPLKSDKLVEFIQKTSGDEEYSDDLKEMVGVVHEDVEIGTDQVGLKVSVADVIEAVSFVYSCKNMIEDHPKMLDAVYDIAERQKRLEEIPGASSVFTAVDPEYLAAEHIFKIYYESIETAIAEKFIGKVLNDISISKTFDVYKGTAELAGGILEIFLPGDSSDRALLPYHSNIANSALRKCAVPILETEESTNDYRLSLLLALKASKACYEIMEETAKGYGADTGYYQHKIEMIENMIMGLYLVSENVAFDTYENYEAFTAQNKAMIINAGILEEPTEYSSILEQLFDEKCWIWNKGVTNGTAYTVVFHVDGTLTYYKMTNGFLGTTSYKYENGLLNIDGIDYIWQENEFVSVEKFEVNGSAQPESFRLWPDDQERFYQFVPAFSVENYADEIQSEFGRASNIEFISCIGSDIQEYPSLIEGVIQETTIDLDMDGREELLVLISKNGSIYLQIYYESNGKYLLSCEEYITLLDYCVQQNISLFYSDKAGGYLLFVDKSSSGAYTGFTGYFAALYVVTPSHIELCGSINEMDYDTDLEEIPVILNEFEVPYAQNCAQINNITTQAQYIELMEIRHSYINTDPFGGWAGREHYLQLLASD